MTRALLALLLAACAGAPGGPAPRAQFEDFVGAWRGRMQASGGGAVSMSLDVEPVAGAPGRFHWRMHYEGQPVRDYTLIVRDRARGEGVIDEGDGVALPVSLHGRELVSVFEVQGNVIDARYRLEPGGLAFALESFRLDRAEEAGRGTRAWRQVAVQRGLLARSRPAKAR